MINIHQFDFSGLRALVRVDFNVPFDDKGQITDDTRMRAALPTLRKILSDGGSIIIATHLGRPKGRDPKLSTSLIVPHLKELIHVPVIHCPVSRGAQAKEMAQALQSGEILVLENVRFEEEEEGKLRNADQYTDEEALKAAKADLKERQKAYAQEMATLADVYVNDAFGAAHRAHATTALIAQYFATDKKMFGMLMLQEVEAVQRVLHGAKHPFTAILGGSKVSSKIDIILNLMNKVDNLIIGGGMAYTFVKAQGGEIGRSLCEEDKIDVARDIMERAKAKGVRLLLPVDTVATCDFANDAPAETYPTNQIPADRMGMDIGAQACADYRKVILTSKTILWNGPAGVFEFDNFARGSEAIAQAVAEATRQGAYSLVGGGDSVACINKLGLGDDVSYVSTGGGALLEAIEGKALPGIVAIDPNYGK